MKRLPVIFITMLGLVALGFVTCEKEVEKIVEAPPAIQVTSIWASDTTVTQGLTVQLSATVETEEGVDAGGLEYSWFAEKGHLEVSSGDTAVWKAPEEDGVAKVSVHVTDGENIAIGNKNIGVNVYTPTADVYYIGAEQCQQCHGGTHTEWGETAHAEAWAGLQSSGHAASYCEPCHSVQQDPTEGNSGYDEVPTMKFEDVQCESCHGPGSAHAGDPSPDNINGMAMALTAETCGICHEGSHHPTFAEWEESAHNFDPAVAAHGAGERSYCQPCHSGTGFVEAYRGDDDRLANLYAESEDKLGITCGVCHDPHDAANKGQLRTLAPVTFVSGKVAAEDGTGQLCIQCHQARRLGEDQIKEGYEHFGPHPGTQGDAVYGTSGYEAVASEDFQFKSSGHGLIEDACAACHVHEIPFGEFEPDSAYTGHTFEPRVEACEQCHGTIASFDDVEAMGDFDGDGTGEGIQSEIAGLRAILVRELVQYDNTVGVGALMGGDVNEDPHAIADSLAHTWQNTSALAQTLRKGGYNLVFSLEEGSQGIHNPAYLVQLLQQSILFLDENAFSGDAVILKENRATTFRATGVAAVNQ